MDHIDIIIYTGFLFLAINSIVFLSSYQFRSKPVKIFTLYLVGSLILQIYSTYLKDYNNKANNLFISHYFFIGKFILLSIFFKYLLKRKVIKKVITIILFTVLIALSLNIAFFSYNYYYSFNLFEIIITTTPIIVYCFMFFIQKIEETDSKFIYITSGIFLYFLCSLLLFSVGNITAEIKKIIWYSNAILYIVYQLLIFVEWYKNFKKKELPDVAK